MGKIGVGFGVPIILVQYGSVQIGGSRFVSPLLSVALSEAFVGAQDVPAMNRHSG